jgi:hypothetical protein
MKDFNEILQYHIEHNLRRVSTKQTILLDTKQLQQLQACLDLHYRLNTINIRPSYGHRALRNMLVALKEAPETKPRFWWSAFKLGVTAMASLVIVMVIGGFNWFGSSQIDSELSRENLRPNGTVDNLQNLNLADAENDSKTIQSESGSVSSAEINLSRTSDIDEAINENF